MFEIITASWLLMPKIVSLLPSSTEIICELGLENQLVGVTHECDYPTSVRKLPKVTRTLIPHDASSSEIDRLVREKLTSNRALYTLDMTILEQLNPDLIVTQALCDVCAVAESEINEAACRLPGTPRVINLEPTSLEEVFDCMRLVGEAAHADVQAAIAIDRLRERVQLVEKRSRLITTRPRVVVLEWIDPPFSSGHWSPELVRLAGGVEVIGIEKQRSRTIRWQDIVSADPDFLIVACCGFDIERTLLDLPILSGYPGFESLTCVRRNQVYVVDGNAYFSRPGPRLVDSLEILANIIDPIVHKLPNNLLSAMRSEPCTRSHE